MRFVIACSLMVAGTAISVAAPPEPASAAGGTTLRPMTVTVLRDPVDKSYRKMLKGMDLFQEMRGVAPQASLRFKLLPRQPGTNMDGIKLAIDADSLSIPVPVHPDNTFTLERHQKALDEDAVVASNRKALSMTWRAEIRTPGLPANTRRLGDLRLECHVGMEADLVSNDRPSFFLKPEPNPIMRKRGYCEARKVGYLLQERCLRRARQGYRDPVRQRLRRVDLPLYRGSAREGHARAQEGTCSAVRAFGRGHENAPQGFVPRRSMT